MIRRRPHTPAALALYASALYARRYLAAFLRGDEQTAIIWHARRLLAERTFARFARERCIT